MKKTRLSVHIDGVWYRVSDGKLHKISRSANGHGGRSELHHRIAGAVKRDASTQISLESSVGDNMKSHTTMSSANKNPCHKPTKKAPSLFNTSDRQGAEITRRRNHGACPFVGGSRPQSEPSHEIGAANHVYDSDESCMSTAASAKKSLVIKIRISIVKAWHLLGVNP